jgi:hypothetical protein
LFLTVVIWFFFLLIIFLVGKLVNNHSILRDYESFIVDAEPLLHRDSGGGECKQ